MKARSSDLSVDDKGSLSQLRLRRRQRQNATSTEAKAAVGLMAQGREGVQMVAFAGKRPGNVSLKRAAWSTLEALA
ncbi:hypothetical protein B296_00017319 [Ensete ventricosum]|uniref:Uncharacterized protein n=1 Tax=Ensete ventricosum TaxID=4639 RepID=A0A427A800_ENSVE|nr:hypothetical protein B296_00017319 [Ensete ventricosum]